MATVDSFGLRVWCGEVQMMSEAHRHHELELNLIFHGSMTYMFGGQTLTLESGQLLLFWGTLPHRLLECNSGTICGWLTLPLATFLRYGLPETLMQCVLHGTPITETMREVDRLLFERWLEDWQRPTSEKQDVLELELGAWLRRLSLTLKSEARSTPKQRQESKAAQLAEFMSEHYQEPLHLADVASVVNLNESYASTLFKNTFSMTILEYLTQHRIAHAQRLLVTTDKSVLEIAFDAGFGSSSQFYAAFNKACGQTPLAYRKRIRKG